MEFLHILESIRSSFLDSFFLTITKLGDESVFLVLSLLFFWCVDKYQGYYLMSVGFAGSTINQILKNVFRIPRPWILDENFTAVESAKERAFGYSFPSGHTQISVGLFGGIAKQNKNIFLRAICLTLCIIIPFSRMYLGVHTPIDICVSVLVALALIFGFHFLFEKAKANSMILYIFFPLLVLMLFGAIIFVYASDLPRLMDEYGLASTQKTLWTLLGSAVGLFVAFIIDDKYTHFVTKARLPIQILKFVLGLTLTMVVKEGLKPILKLLMGDFVAIDAIRYAVLVIIACGLWPMTFRFFDKTGRKTTEDNQ